MIIQRIFVQNASIILPSVFSTSNEISSVLSVYSGTRFCIIKPEDFTPCLAVERKGNKLEVVATSIANAKKVFDSKVTSKRASKIPLGHVFHFNLDGKVLGVKRKDLTCLSLDTAKLLVASTGLSIVTHECPGSKLKFIELLLKCLLDEKKIPWEGTVRTGFYIGGGDLKHTNTFALPGVIAPILSPEAGVRIKGIYKHATDYSETVFWFELKQCAPTIFEILKEENLKSNFMETLNKCL